MTFTTYTVSFSGINVNEVMVQVQLSSGLPSFTIVGMPDKTVSESKERVRAALYFLGIPLPAKRIVVSLSPAHITKIGNHYDLPIAVAILQSLGILPELRDFIIMGELSLNAQIHSVKGILPATIWSIKNNKQILFPYSNYKEVSILNNNSNIMVIDNLQSLIDFFKKHKEITNFRNCISSNENVTEEFNENKDMELKLEPVFGHMLAKRILTIAVAGHHNLLLIGPPGSGKSLIARYAGFIAGKLDEDKALESSSIHSIAGQLLEGNLLKYPPFRSPHHSASVISIVGGGNNCNPGEISLAHNGILFLDEFAEFPQNIIDTLRQPMELGTITLSRIRYNITYPAKFLLIAAMNPCKCGYFSSLYRKCICSIKDVRNYLSKISGPIKQRIALAINMDIQENFLKNSQEEDGIQWAFKAQEDVKKCREFQKKYNLDLAASEIFQSLEKDEKILVNKIMEKYKFSTREIYNLLLVARTIANISESLEIKIPHLSEASSYVCFFHHTFDQMLY